MQLVGIISLLAAFSSSTHALVRRGAPEGTTGTIDCAYMINFPDNVDGPAAVKAHFDATKIKYTVRIAFKNKLANFVSVNIDGDCDATKQLSPIKGAVYYSTVRLVERPEPVRRSQSEKKPTPEQIHTITGVNEVRKRFGLTGKGINVAVIDTGVYWRHPAMGGGFGDGFKVAKGYDFVGDKFTGYIDSPPAVEDKDPDDNCDVSSHGTHVAGIVAADARGIKDPAWAPAVPFTGVAPDAKIFAYRVFGCEGVADDDYIAAAIYQAAADGAHILNLSLGFGPAYHDDGSSVAIDKVRRLGHFVIVSAGNSGASGSFIHGAPGVAHSAIGVASFDNVAAPQTVIRVDNLPFIYTLGAANGNFAEGEVLDIIVNNLDADAKDVQDDGTKPLNPPVKADGKAMLIRWGSPSLGGSAVRCDYAFNAGAKACILYSDTETMTPILGSAKIPSMFTTNAAGKSIIAAIKAGKKPVVTVSLKPQMNDIPTGATLSDFTSPGLDFELGFKPDLGSIGGHVYSTVSPFSAAANKLGENYNVMSGTSMASPYLAGIAALMLQARGTKLSFEEFRAYLQNSASLRPIYGTSIIHSPSYQGAGLVNALYAVSAKTLVMPSALALNDTANIKKRYSITIKNNHNVRMTYYLNGRHTATVNSLIPGDDHVQDQSTTTFTNSTPATLKFDGGDGYGSREAWSFKRVTVERGASVVVSFSITPPKNADPKLYPVYGGFISISNDLDDHRISVPYAGVVGVWKDRKIWSRTSPSVIGKWLIPTVQNYNPSIKVNNLGATGIYQDLTFTPLAPNAALKASLGAYILAIPAFQSRNATIEVEYAGTDQKALTQAGLKTSSRIYVYSPLYQAAFLYGFEPLRRSTYASNTIFIWEGFVLNAKGDFLVKLPPGPYRMKFSALKNFGVASNANDYDVVISPVFNLVD